MVITHKLAQVILFLFNRERERGREGERERERPRELKRARASSRAAASSGHRDQKRRSIWRERDRVHGLRDPCRAARDDEEELLQAAGGRRHGDGHRHSAIRGCAGLRPCFSPAAFVHLCRLLHHILLLPGGGGLLDRHVQD
jgi:hypothetical protein